MAIPRRSRHPGTRLIAWWHGTLTGFLFAVSCAGLIAGLRLRPPSQQSLTVPSSFSGYNIELSFSAPSVAAVAVLEYDPALHNQSIRLAIDGPPNSVIRWRLDVPSGLKLDAANQDGPGATSLTGTASQLGSYAAALDVSSSEQVDGTDSLVPIANVVLPDDVIAFAGPRMRIALPSLHFSITAFDGWYPPDPDHSKVDIAVSDLLLAGWRTDTTYPNPVGLGLWSNRLVVSVYYLATDPQKETSAQNRLFYSGVAFG